ncbi:MAG: helix-turn-helix transcriptional regulator [Kiritimatiellae bacterium]|nr:helix-turn-helix transcriptional regulator [Kiritimatiellia bacterium]
MDLSEYQLYVPEEVSVRLAEHIRRLRLNHKWKQSTLAERSGVALPTLRRFERTGLISLKHLLRLAFALGRLDDFWSLLEPSAAGSIKEMESIAAAKERKRGVK